LAKKSLRDPPEAVLLPEPPGLPGTPAPMTCERTERPPRVYCGENGYSCTYLRLE
jgi:hypothetical protein